MKFVLLVSRGRVTFPMRTRGGSPVLIPITFSSNDNGERIAVTNSTDNESLSSKDTTKSAGSTTDESHFTTRNGTDRTSTSSATTIATETLAPQGTYEYSNISESSVGKTLSFVGTTSRPALGRPLPDNDISAANGHSSAKHTACINILFMVALTLGKLQEN